MPAMRPRWYRPLLGFFLSRDGVALLRDPPHRSPSAPPGPSLAGDSAKGEAMTDGETTRAEMIEVVDSVIRPAEIYQDTPVENEILTDQDIEEFPAITPIEDLNEIPSVRIQTQGQGRPGLISIAELPHKYSDLLVNGQRYSREIQEEMDLGDLLFMGPEKIEIPRRPKAFRFSARVGLVFGAVALAGLQRRSGRKGAQ